MNIRIAFKLILSLVLFFFLQTAEGQTDSGNNVHALIKGPDTLYICETDIQARLQANEAVYYRWAPIPIFDNANAQNPIVKPTQSTWVFLTALVNGTLLKDSVYLSILKPSLIKGASNENPVCAGAPLLLPITSNTGAQGITWVSDEKISVLRDGSALIFPNKSGSVTVSQQVGVCKSTATFSFKVTPTKVTIKNEGDTIEICKGTKLTLKAETNTGNNAGITWLPADKYIDNPKGGSVRVDPVVSTTYIATFEQDGCVVKDSVRIRVDSLPSKLLISKDENKEQYCQGTIVKLTSQVYDPAAYPDIKHKWFPYKGFESPDSLYNLVITTIDSIILFRATSNHACRDTQPAIIPVIKPKDLKLVPKDTTLCFGEKVTLNLSFSGNGEVSWEPEDAVSCKSCKNPTVFINQSKEIKATVKEKDCPTTITAKVNILPPPSIGFNTKTTICRGEELQLLTNNDPSVTYTWSSSTDPAFTSTNPLIKVKPLTNTTYTVKAQAGKCAPTTASLNVSVIQPSTVTVPANLTVCPGLPVTLEAAGNAAVGVEQQYKWLFNNQTVLGPKLSLSSLSNTTTFILDYTYGPNCGAERKSVTVTVATLPRLTNFKIEPVESATAGVPLGEKILISGNLQPINQPGITYSWKANGKDIPGTSPILEHTPTENPTTYTLTVKNANGCESSFKSPPIPVLAPVFDIPSAFTPDGDGVNDFFNVVFRGKIDITTFHIFNRWGQLVYKNETPTTGWDGNHNGGASPSDVYVYYIVIKFPDGKEFIKKGDLTLFR
jgi:gliding motility-associated-like protein